MPLKVILSRKAKHLASKYTLEYCKKLLREDRKSCNQLFEVSQGGRSGRMHYTRVRKTE